MGITRSRLSIDEHFTAVPNEWARDDRLSRRARGLLVEVMSHRVGWHVTIRSLAKAGKEGRDAIQTALNELLEHGYVKRSQGRAAAGKFAEIEYELCDPPTVAGFSVHGSAVSGSTVSGESATKKNISSEDHSEEDHSLLSPDESADGSLIPEDWRPNQTHIDKATSLRLDVGREYRRFRDHAERTHRRLKNWNAGFTNWLRKQAEFAQQRAGAPSTPRTFAQQKQDNNLALLAEYREGDGRAEVGNGRAGHLRAIDPGA